MQIEALSYVPASRLLIDENGLGVAHAVNPDDAARIIAAMSACRGLPDLMAETMDSHVYGDGDERPADNPWQRVADLAKAAGADEPRPVVLSPLAALLDFGHKVLEYEADQFDGAPGVDLNVSGADLVDAFTGWRTELRALLAAVMVDRSTEPLRIGVCIEGGNIQDIWAERSPLERIEVTTIDYDTDGADRSDITMVRQDRDGGWSKAHVSEWDPSLGMCPINETAPASRSCFDDEFWDADGEPPVPAPGSEDDSPWVAISDALKPGVQNIGTWPLTEAAAKFGMEREAFRAELVADGHVAVNGLRAEIDD